MILARLWAYFSRYLCAKSVQRDRLQLVGVAALLIGGKHEEVNPHLPGTFACARMHMQCGMLVMHIGGKHEEVNPFTGHMCMRKNARMALNLLV